MRQTRQYWPGYRPAMSSAPLLLGTSSCRQQVVESWLPNWAVRIGQSHYPGPFPDGVAHGVPEGGAGARCGAVPPYLWPQPFGEANSRILEVCGSCCSLAPPGPPEVTARMPHDAAPSAGWSRRIGAVTLLLVVAFVALLWAFPRVFESDAVSDECRAARDKLPNLRYFPAQGEEVRRVCGSDPD